VAATSAHSTPTTYFGENASPSKSVLGDPVAARNSFLQQLTDTVQSLDFEAPSFVVDTNAGSNGLVLHFNGSSGSKIDATLRGDGIVSKDTSSGRFNTTTPVTPPGQWWDTSAFQFTIEFSTPISAFGFYATDVGDFRGLLSLKLYSNNVHVKTLDISNTFDTSTTNGSLLFFGFVDRSIKYDKISFVTNYPPASSQVDYFGFDDMVIGDLAQVKAVPEPASFGLMALGLLAVAAARRKSLR
jgi:hypothetical protein